MMVSETAVGYVPRSVLYHDDMNVAVNHDNEEGGGSYHHRCFSTTTTRVCIQQPHHQQPAPINVLWSYAPNPSSIIVMLGS